MRCGLRGLFCAALLGAALAGCNKDAINRDAKTSFLTADDMKAMTDQMAQSIIGNPVVQQEMARGPMRIVVKPVINETSEIITDNRKEMFVHRLQGLLSQDDAMRGRFTWCVNRDDYQKLRAEEIPEAQLGPTEDRIQPDYALYARFLSDTNTTTKARSDMYLCQYQLTRISGAATGEIVWTGQYITSKQVKKGFLD
jgi:PBP1b-binding outer membrane lipoprotein LpoB